MVRLISDVPHNISRIPLGGYSLPERRNVEKYKILIALNNLEDMSNLQIAANSKFIRDTARAAYNYIKSLPEVTLAAERTAEEGQQGG